MSRLALRFSASAVAIYGCAFRTLPGLAPWYPNTVNNILRRLDLPTLQLFLAIHEEGALTRAAEREAIAVSAASKRLADMEQARGVALYLRAGGHADPRAVRAGRAQRPPRRRGGPAHGGGQPAPCAVPAHRPVRHRGRREGAAWAEGEHLAGRSGLCRYPARPRGRHAASFLGAGRNPTPSGRIRSAFPAHDAVTIS
ncbi:LysR family transcriptional regulator [Massilia sp. NEAU-DD11]|uniref:LysR family transcriptional regulator n=1 Tax=Massilia cellulosiltytica TaxID=2683234 RepID=A0A7X3K6T1_9BURK|nr:LysR family transcriptional regulator [Telluria cellulosilytica]